MSDRNFDVLAICGADLAHPGIALAASRAGGLGILDLEWAADPHRVRRNWERLLASSTGRIGLRTTPATLALARDLLASVGARALTLTVILAAPAGQLRAMRAALGESVELRYLGEVLGIQDLAEVESLCQGSVARGHEAGGWVGEDSSFILAQKVSAQATKPFFVQGGVGLRAAAACRAAGAAGVVLDDALLLLAESPLAADGQRELSRLNGAECRLFGELLGRPCRVYGRPASAALKAAEADLRAAEGDRASTVDAWAAALQARIGWATSDLVPLGQAVGLAAHYRDRFGNVGALVQAVRRESLRQMDRAAELRFLDEGGPLALSHGTRWPLAQGPMTRVSDSPEFASAVAREGALPFLALALLRGPQVGKMLEQTRSLAGGKPWGVGMLGFIPQALRDEQCAAIWACPPSYALIAGGRPDQAAEFESRGIPTYIHAPAPALLRLYLEQGARRFVFEGRECGGHVGPIGSFPLWEQMVEVLLEQVPAGKEAQVHLLFAGGVHDARSAAMLAALTAPLADRGMKVGALMGTAYLFTREIVSTGAVVQGFQAEALRCERTMNLESGPGHASRCVDTPFAHEFYQTRRRLIGEGRGAEEIRNALEDLNLGRLRMASKGTHRDSSGAVVTVADADQQRDGMYMIGQVATLRSGVQSLAELHADVCTGGQALLGARVQARRARQRQAQPSDIAIVGIGVTLPGANSADDYWKLILDQRCVIRQVPADRWDPQMFFDADPKARDKVYSQWGGFLEEVPFDPLRYGVPPRSMKSIDPFQLLSLETAARTLADAGYADGRFDRENTSVILGASGGAGDLGVQYGLRAELPRFVENPSPEVWDRLPEWTEESFAGTLLNVAAGRIANRLDFGGINMTVDAACGSSLAAIGVAVHELETGRSNLVLAGGFDTTQGMFGFTAFAKTSALSPKGQPRTFDQAADGIAISEGVAMVALKRLADAEADGDRIYAVIKAVSGSSDGKALGLTAPRSEGQVRSLQRAYAKAGFSPATLGLVEAHGTGTVVGDRTEAQTIAGALRAAGAEPRSVAIGSVKTLIGHTKAAAGVSGLIKVALSLYHRALPAHHGVTQPIDTIADPSAPVCLLNQARPWTAAAGVPRRAAVSAFGFGGANFHAVLEEAPGGAAAPRGGRHWPAELFLFRAADAAALAAEIESLLPHLQDGSRVVPGELAAALARRALARRPGTVALAMVARDLKSVAADLAAAVAHLRGGVRPLPGSVRLSLAVPETSPTLGFLFPGQGSQYVGMGREAALFLPQVREALELADRVLATALGSPLTRLLLPPAAFDPETEAAQSAALTDTRVAQPAIGALALGYLRLAEHLGLEARSAAGHSFGEYAALMAAGVIDPADFLRLAAARGDAMAQAAGTARPGGMAAVRGRRERVSDLIAGFEGVCVSNHNAPEQTVVSGPRAELERAVGALTAAGLRCTLLPVSGAFHTELVAPARAPLSAAIRSTPFRAPRIPVFANATGARYPEAPESARDTLDAHLLASVEFVTGVEAMYAQGCRVFLELGPKGTCASMAREILAGRDAVAISLDAHGGGLRGTLLGLAELFVAGVAFDPASLFAERAVAALDFDRLPELGQPAVYPRHWWMLSGGCARPVNDPVLRTGLQPALTRATADAARAALERQMPPPVATTRPSPALDAPRPDFGPASLPVAPGASASLSSEAWMAYQQTMRQFLALQERVVGHYLSGTTGPVSAATAVPLAPVPAGTAQPHGASGLPAVPAAAPTITAPAVAPANPAKSPGAAPAVAAPPALDIAALLLAVVSERTGYPPEMLGLDAELEADLGIDSIKRVEIIGALRKALPEAAGTALQVRMERLTKARSLRALQAEIQPLADTGTAVVAAVAAPGVRVAAPAVAAPPALDIAALLLAVVSERTGYPPEMLGLDAELEADLGIDSIKRVEIIGALRKALPEAAGTALQARMERLTKARSLRALQAEIQPLASAQAPTAADPAPAATIPAEPLAASAIPVADDPALPRYVVAAHPAPLASSRIDPGGVALLLGGPDPIVTQVAQQLDSLGWRALCLDPCDPEALRQAITAARDAHGAPRALLHLQGLDLGEAQDIESWRASYRRDLMSLFHALQTLTPDLGTMRVIGASRLGGTFGRDAVGKGLSLAGGVNGILNCLRQEAPGCVARAVDFDGQSDAEIAGLLVQELMAEDPEPEAGYVDGRRYGARSVLQPLTPNPFPAKVLPASDWVVLATGGARGITAEVVAELARPGMRMVLLGRSAEPEAETAELAGHVTPAELKKALIARLLARGQSPRPVEVERELARVLADREIRANLARLRRGGALVQYVACDVRDSAALGGLIDDLYTRYGRIDAVIHGAGVIEDKLIAEKAAESFERVLGAKLDAAYVFATRLRADSLRLLAFFTSVAGRYGNRGQADYAAANEALNRCAWMLHRRFTHARVLSVNWGPWDAGMASDGVKSAFRERGMVPIPVPAGCRFFMDELAHGPRHDVELVAGEGPWGDPAESRQPVGSVPQLQQAGPLVRAAASIGAGGALTLEHCLTLGSDAYLDDHRIDGRAVLPMAMALEYMAQFAAAGWPGYQVAELRDARLYSGLALDDDGRCELLLRARAATHSDAGSQAVTVEICDTRQKGKLSYRATVVLMPLLPDAPAAKLATTEATRAFETRQVYSDLLFHGPRFHRLLSLSLSTGPAAVIEATVRPSSPRELLGEDVSPGAGWLLDPALIDVPPQLALVWTALESGRGALPSRMACVQRYGNGPLPPEGLRLRMRAAINPETSTFEYEAEFVDPAGRVRLAIRNGESTVSAALGRLSPRLRSVAPGGPSTPLR